MRADGRGVVLPGVLARQFVDVPPGLVASDSLGHVSQDLGPGSGGLPGNPALACISRISDAAFGVSRMIEYTFVL